jgi:hypothetical protein
MTTLSAISAAVECSIDAAKPSTLQSARSSSDVSTVRTALTPAHDNAVTSTVIFTLVPTVVSSHYAAER